MWPQVRRGKRLTLSLFLFWHFPNSQIVLRRPRGHSDECSLLQLLRTDQYLPKQVVGDSGCGHHKRFRWVHKGAISPLQDAGFGPHQHHAPHQCQIFWAKHKRTREIYSNACACCVKCNACSKYYGAKSAQSTIKQCLILISLLIFAFWNDCNDTHRILIESNKSVGLERACA